MPDPARKSIDQIFQEGEPVDQAVAAAVKEAVLRHKRLGNPIVVARDGKATLVPADEIAIEGDLPTTPSKTTRRV